MAKNGNILNTISSLYRSLTKTEKKIADAILLNPDLAVQCPLAEIAAHLEVGEATFVRFCRTLGLKDLVILNWNYPSSLRLKMAKITPY